MYNITKLQMWVLRYITKRIVRQSQWHQSNIIKYYEIMNDAAKAEFAEDHKPSLDAFLKFCFDVARETDE